MNILDREPVLFLGVIRALVVCVTAFGLNLSVEQTGAIYLLAEAVLSLMARARVSPVEAVTVPVEEDGQGGIATIVWFLLAIILVVFLARLLGVA